MKEKTKKYCNMNGTSQKAWETRIVKNASNVAGGLMR